jgi:predicted secreted protein
VTVTSGIVVFILIWWLVFFMTLPWGVRRAGEEARGHDAGAPVNPRLWTKAGIATGISAVIFALVWWGIERGGLSFR